MKFPHAYVHANWHKGDFDGFSRSPDNNKGCSVWHAEQLAEIGLEPLEGDEAWGLVTDLKRAAGAESACEITGFTVPAGEPFAYKEQLVFIPQDPRDDVEDDEWVSGDYLRTVTFSGSGDELTGWIARDDTRRDGWMVGISDGTTEPDFASGGQVRPGEPFDFEIVGVVDSGSNDGWAQCYINGKKIGQTLTGLTQSPFTGLEIGAVNASTVTTGYLVRGEVILTDERVYPTEPSYGEEMVRLVDRSQHIALDGVVVTSVELVDPSADSTVKLYDTDRAKNRRGTLRAAVSLNTPWPDGKMVDDFIDGCFVELGGTNTQALVRFTDPSEYDVEDDEDDVDVGVDLDDDDDE